jgi:hypothetical protein
MAKSLEKEHFHDHQNYCNPAGILGFSSWRGGDYWRSTIKPMIDVHDRQLTKPLLEFHEQ